MFSDLPKWFMALWFTAFLLGLTLVFTGIWAMITLVNHFT